MTFVGLATVMSHPATPQPKQRTLPGSPHEIAMLPSSSCGRNRLRKVGSHGPPGLLTRNSECDNFHQPKTGADFCEG